MTLDENYYEVCFTVSPDPGSNQITYVRPDKIFRGNRSEDVVIKVKAGSEEEAEEQARKLLADPNGPYVSKYGPGLEVKTKYIWKVVYM